jgi:hypothetical protein
MIRRIERHIAPCNPGQWLADAGIHRSQVSPSLVYLQFQARQGIHKVDNPKIYPLFGGCHLQWAMIWGQEKKQ